MRKKIIDWLFYDYINNMIEEHFYIDIYLMVGEKLITKTVMKYLPRVGDLIEFNVNSDMVIQIFEVEKIKIMQFGSVVTLSGKIV